MSALHERVRWGPFPLNLIHPPPIDLHPISHYNISTESNRKVMRLEEMITWSPDHLITT